MLTLARFPASLRRRSRRALGRGGPWLLAVAVTVLSGSALAGEDLLPGDEPGFRWGYLQNGSGYLVWENHAAPMIGAAAVIQGGSGAEDWSTQGASHFLEHLLFNGTESRTQEQIYDEMDLAGAYHNATTRNTHVAFLLLAPETTFWSAFGVLTDMLFRSTLPPEKVEKERGVILEELAKDRAAETYDLERVLDLDLFGPRGYGLPTLGSETSIRSLGREQILDFYRANYLPNRITWVMIGDIDSGAAVDSLETRIGIIPAGSSAPPVAPGVETEGPRLRVHQLDVAGPVLRWAWTSPDPKSESFNEFTARFQLMCEGVDSPLGRRCLEAWPGKVQDYFAGIQEFPGFSLLSVRLSLDGEAEVPQVLDAFPSLVEEASAEPVDPARVDGWRLSAETDEIYLREKPHYYGILRGEMIAARGLAAMAGYRASLQGVTPGAVAAVPSPLSASPFRISVVLPVARPAAAAPGAPAERAHDRWTLENGAQVLALSSPESEIFAVHLFVRDRSAREPAGKAGIAELLHELLGRATLDHDASALGTALQQIGAELKTADDPSIPYDDFYSVPEFSFVRFQTLDRFAEPGLKLLAEIVGHPALSEDDFAQAKAALLQRAERSERSARDRVRQRIASFLDPGAPAAGVFGSPESVASITLDDLRRFAPSYLDPRSFLFVVVSGRPLEDLRAIVDRTLGEIPRPAGEPPALSPLGPTEVAAAGGTADSLVASFRERVDALARESGQETLWREAIGGPPPPAPGPRALLADSVGSNQAYLAVVRLLRAAPDMGDKLRLTSAILSDRIAFQLREREGLAYSIGASLRRLGPEVWIWTESGGTRAENLPRVLEGFEEAPQWLRDRPADETEVRKTASSLYGRGLMRRMSRLNLAYYSGLALLAGEDPLKIEDRERALSEGTPAGVREALDACWQPGPALVVIAR